MNNQKAILNTPKDINTYTGEFVIFFSEDVNPEVLYHTFNADDAYKKAEEIKNKEGRQPVVYRVQEKQTSNIARIIGNNA